ncbi:uncharacterized protein KQ657_001422 [Scheffersomyces spartinae]|uniref:Mitochondrial genome maintenance protein MGM101 n=1 Tax=Scheffersomyces spartinae TaxID=45513 RepID=A0A9P8AHL4_9ASCO|nr:uncharacterized protein KQ657_001422 [Scheffersomyces spartinae]KAG7192642.1 hypothetical protein KQ657_001422 [Scheffersomyces spartinae]
MFLRSAAYPRFLLSRSVRTYASTYVKYVPSKSRSAAGKTTLKSVASSTKTSDTEISEPEGDTAVLNQAEADVSSSIVSFKDSPVILEAESKTLDWSLTFHGLGSKPFPSEIADILLAPIDANDIEIKPDGLLYLPEIKYRRILNRAFGPGGWGLAPRTESLITPKQISREYALICHGRLVSVARGEQDYFGGDEKVTTALEGCKSNALMRCCKDLGIASELWDPSFIRQWKQKYCDEVFAEHVVTKRKKKLWKLKKNPALDYPYKMT